jgi:hypothetical protein
MKYKLTTPIVNLEGEQTTEGDGKRGTMYLGLTRALMADHNDQGEPIKGDDKIKRYDLLMKIRKQDEVDLDVEEVALLSRAVLIFPTLVAGQIRAFLNQRG